MSSTKYTYNRGVSLIELLTVLFIIGMLSGLLIANFSSSSRSPAARHQTAVVFEGSLRRVQSMALSGTQFNDQPVCGYGIHYVDPQTYLIYTVDHPTDCLSASKRYVGTTQDVERIAFTNKNMQFDGSFFDIFFEAPDGVVYINDTPNRSTASIAIRSTDVASGCSNPDDCTVITVYPFGRIDIDK